MAITIYHNPRCGKSREGLALLLDRGVEPVVVDYMKVPIGRGELKKLLKKLGMTPRELLRNKEKAYREMNLKDPGMSDDALIDAMLEEPKLMERPIVVSGDKAVVGRPAERILEIL